MKRHTLGTCMVLALGLSALAVPAAGRQSMALDDGSGSAAPAEVRPPAPADPGKHNIIVPYLVAALLGGLAVGLAIMPSKRTHQD